MTSETITPKPSLYLPWKARINLSLLTTMLNLSRRSNGTINRRLFNFFEPKSPPNPIPVNGVKTADVTVDPSRNLWFRLFIPTQPTASTTLPVIVFFHGGGFAYLGPDSTPFDDVCRRYAREISAVVVSVDYRLIPEHRYPAQYVDGLDVLKFLDDVVGRKFLPRNADFSRFFLAGDSAGGNIAHHVAERACQYTFQRVKVKGLVAIQPFFGGEERTESEIRLDGMPIVSMKLTDWLWNVFFPQGEKWNRDHEVINVSGPNAKDLSIVKDFPATMVVIGGFDTLQDWQRKYYQWLKRCGKEVCLMEYPNVCHGFYTFTEILESGELISQIKKFIDKDRTQISSPLGCLLTCFLNLIGPSHLMLLC